MTIQTPALFGSTREYNKQGRVCIEMGSINLSNFPKFANKYYFLVVLKNYHVQGAISIVLLNETIDKVWILCYGNEIKLAYEHLQAR
jgi:hypothetical protein